MAGVPSLPLTSLSDAGGADIPDLDLETQWQQLLAESPQLKSAESELDHGWATLRQSEAQAIPNVTLQVVADYDRVTRSTTASTLVALPLPIYNRNQWNIDKEMADGGYRRRFETGPGQTDRRLPLRRKWTRKLQRRLGTPGVSLFDSE